MDSDCRKSAADRDRFQLAAAAERQFDATAGAVVVDEHLPAAQLARNPHLARAITVVILIETIFLLSVFAEIFVTTGGGPGLQTTNIAFLVFRSSLKVTRDAWPQDRHPHVHPAE